MSAAYSTLLLLLLHVFSAVDGQITVLDIYAQGDTLKYPMAVPIGSTIVFQCTIPSITSYSGSFMSAELHAQVSNVDTLMCTSAQSGGCPPNSQNPPFEDRVISSIISDSIGVTFTMTNATTSDALNYYCKIITKSMTYSLASYSTLIVYALALTPSCTFAGYTNIFISGNALPRITCTTNVGAPTGYVTATVTRANGASTAYAKSFVLITDMPAVLSNGTTSLVDIFGYLDYGAPFYTLTSFNDGDTITVYAYNSYAAKYLTTLAPPSYSMTIEVQYAVSTITITTTDDLAPFLKLSRGIYYAVVPQYTNATLKCNAQGNPAPSFTWTQIYSPYYQIVSTGADLSGTLTEAGSFTYQCYASNVITARFPSSTTSQTATVVVTVTEIPTTTGATTTTTTRRTSTTTGPTTTTTRPTTTTTRPTTTTTRPTTRTTTRTTTRPTTRTTTRTTTRPTTTTPRRTTTTTKPK